MAIRIADIQGTIAPTAADTELARESSRQLSKLLVKHPADSKSSDFKLRIKADDESEE